MIGEKCLVRHFASTQQTLEEGDLEDAYWLPGTENPTDELTMVRSDVVPSLRVLVSGSLRPGQLRSLRGVAWKERVAHATRRNPLRMRTFRAGWMGAGVDKEIKLRI